VAKTRTADPVAFLRDDANKGDGLAMAAWGFAAVMAVVLGYASWQFRPPAAETVTARAVTPDGEAATGSIEAGGETAGGTSTAVRPVGGARIGPAVLGGGEPQPTMRDLAQLRSDLRDLQRRIAQMGLSGDGVSRRLDRLEARLDTAAASGAAGRERVATAEADGPAGTPGADAAAKAAGGAGAQAIAEAVRMPQPKPEDLPAVTGSVPPKTPAAPAKTDREAAPAGEPPKAVTTTAAVPMGPIAALDLGGHRSLVSLKTAWSDMSDRYAEFGSGIEPLARLNETEAGVEARLVVGPYPNPTEASKACVRLRTLGLACAVTGYSGQPLSALR
jgi:hypothetical protein